MNFQRVAGPLVEDKRKRIFVTYLAFSEANQLALLKKDHTRTLDNYVRSLVEANSRINGLQVFADAQTENKIREITGAEHLPIIAVKDDVVLEMRERFLRYLVDGAKSMLSGRGLSLEAEADYLAVTHAKLHRLLDAAHLNEKSDDFTWIDAGIFMPTHSQKHGRRPYSINQEGSGEVVYASSFDPREIWGRDSFSERVLTNISKSQLCGPAFTLTRGAISPGMDVSSELIDRSIRKFGYIPTEQCTYFLAFLHFGHSPKYISRHYRDIYKKVLSGPRPSHLESFLGWRILRQYESAQTWTDW